MILYFHLENGISFDCFTVATYLSELTLVQPEVCPPLHGYQVPEPLVSCLVIDHDGHPLLARLRGVGRVHQDAALPDMKNGNSRLDFALYDNIKG